MKVKHFMVLTRAAVVAVAVAAAAGCSERSTPNTALQGKVVIRGDETFGQRVGPRLVAAFQAEFPNVSVEFEAGGVAASEALVKGECDVAAVSRPLSGEDVRRARAVGTELDDEVVGFYGVAVIVNSNNPIRSLTAKQVDGVFSGAVQSWSALGWGERPIRVYVLSEAAEASVGFRELAMGGRPFGAGTVAATNFTQLGEGVALDANGVGYTTVQVPVGARAVSIGGILCSAAAVNEGDYPYYRALRLYARKVGASAATKEFLRFVLSRPGQRIMREAGFVGRLDARIKDSLGD